MAEIQSTDVKQQQQAEYGSCKSGHPDIIRVDQAESIIEQATSDKLEELRNSIHQGGHFDLASAAFNKGDTGIRLVEDLTKCYKGVIAEVLGTADGEISSRRVVGNDAALAAMSERILRVGLIKKHGKKAAPDVEKATADISGLVNYHDEDKAAALLSNILTIFRAADHPPEEEPDLNQVSKASDMQSTDAATEEKKFPLTTKIIQEVFNCGFDKITRQAPSPIRESLVRSGVSTYDDTYHREIATMCYAGSFSEVDVALVAIDQFIIDEGSAAGKRANRRDLFVPALKILVEGGNFFLSDRELNAFSEFENYPGKLNDKARELINKLSFVNG